MNILDVVFICLLGFGEREGVFNLAQPNELLAMSWQPYELAKERGLVMQAVCGGWCPFAGGEAACLEGHCVLSPMMAGLMQSTSRPSAPFF